MRILWELNYLLFQATFNQYDEVARFHNIQMHNQISCLTEKVRALELAKVHHRKQQAIAMAALAAEKLNSQKQMNEFQSDSNHIQQPTDRFFSIQSIDQPNIFYS